MTMILHRGAVQVSRDTLLRVTPPERQGIYVPMPHHELADAVQQYLAEGNFEVTGEKHARDTVIHEAMEKLGSLHRQGERR